VAPAPSELLHAFAPRSSSDDAAEEALLAVWSAATGAWPGVKLAPARFMDHLAQRAPDGWRSLSELYCSDLFLACACLQADPTALARLDDSVLPSLDSGLRRLDSNPAFVEEAKQQVRLRLLLANQGPPKLSEYAGEGSLLRWTRVVAVRVGLKLQRSRRHDAPSDEDATLAALPAVGNVELDYLRTQHRADFSAAFVEALASLEPRDRNVLRLNLIDKLNIEQIGALYGTHRATIARWIAAARADLITRTRRGLATRLKMNPDELDSLMGLVVSQLEISINRFLREG
jgi:RNA polymerase sigma-70 factor (ECF subfamily)